MRGGGEFCHLDKTYLLVNHISHIDAVCRYHVSCDGEAEQFIDATSLNLDVYLGSATNIPTIIAYM